MTRVLACWLALVATTSAGQLPWPQAATDGSGTHATANTLYCTRRAAEQTITVTAIYAMSTDGNASTCGFGVYEDTDDTGSAHVLASASASCANAANTVVGATSLSLTLTAGVIYRVCGCASVANVTFLRPVDVGTSSILRTEQLRNSVTTTHGTADGQPCSSGVPPDRTGALTSTSALSTGSLTLLLVE